MKIPTNTLDMLPLLQNYFQKTAEVVVEDAYGDDDVVVIKINGYLVVYFVPEDKNWHIDEFEPAFYPEDIDDYTEIRQTPHALEAFHTVVTHICEVDVANYLESVQETNLH